MKKFSKILCFALMLSLIVTASAIFIGAEAPSPTMKITEAGTGSGSVKAMYNHTVSTREGNQLDNLSWVASGASSNPTDLLKSYVIEDNVNGGAYVALYAPETKSGIHAQYSASTSTDKMPKMSNQHFYVIELDIATQSTLHSEIRLTAMHRNVDGKGTKLMGSSVTFSKYVTPKNGDWVHVTIIGQLDVVFNDVDAVDKEKTINQSHIFIDGAYVDSQIGAVDDSNLTNTYFGVENYNESDPATNGLYAQGFRVEIASASYANAGESTVLDNLYRRDYSKADAEANGLAAIVNAKGNISEWSGYPETTMTGKSLPAFIEIGGVKYNNAAAASEILNGNEKIDATFIGENVAPVTVSCDSTITTNGFNVAVTPVSGATVDTSTEGIIEIDAPFTTALVQTPANKSSIYSAIKYDAPDNKFDYINQTDGNFAGATSSSAFLQQYIEKIDGDDNQYASYVALNDKYLTTGDAAVHAHTNLMYPSGTKLTIGDNAQGTDQYIITDFDMYTRSDWPMSLHMGYIARTTGPKGGNSFSFDGYWSKINIGSHIPTGEWFHITIVGDVQTNTSYFYVNNVLVATSAVGGGIADSLNTIKGGTATIDGWRINVQFDAAKGAFTLNEGDMFALDNAYLRVLVGSEAGNLFSNIGATSLNAWDKGVYNASYGETNYPERLSLAKIDGTVYNSYADVEAILSGNDEFEVELIAPVTTVLNINANAVIKTNGFEFVEGKQFKVPTGSTVVTEGETVKITVPYQPNVSYTHISGSGATGNNALALSLATGVEGNLITGGTWIVNNDVSGNKLLVPFKALDDNGDEYLALFPSELSINGHKNNPFVYYENRELRDGSNIITANSYYVIDIDVYSENEAITELSITPTVRTASNGAGPNGIAYEISDALNGKTGWTHITYVGDLSTNTAYIFVDGEFQKNNGMAIGTTNSYVGMMFTGFRLNLPGMVQVSPDSMVGVRNVAVRLFSDNTAAGGIASAIEAGNLSGWAKNVAYYNGPATAIAIIDGVKYTDTKAASAALATGGEHEVEFLHDFLGTITTSDSAVLNAHGFGELAINSVPEVLEDGTILAGNLVKDGNKYVKLNLDNCEDYCVRTEWYNDDYTVEEYIYFPYGYKVEYIGIKHRVGNYIEGGKLYSTQWWQEDEEANAYPAEWPIAQSTDELFWYFTKTTDTETDITVTEGMKYNLSLHSNFDVNVFIKDANGKYEIGGEKYALYTKDVAVNNLASDIAFEITFERDGVTYTEKFTVNVLEYATTVLNKADVSDQMKRVMMAALDYANEAYKLLNGTANAEIAAILANPSYAGYTVEDDTSFGAANTDALASVISGAQLYLDSNAAFMLKIANGYTGNITVKYTDYKGQAFTETFNVTEGQEYVTVSLKVYNLDADLEITAGDVSGVYNLGGYIKGLVEGGTDADFAQALFTYAKVAKEYQTALNNATK